MDNGKKERWDFLENNPSPYMEKERLNILLSAGYAYNKINGEIVKIFTGLSSAGALTVIDKSGETFQGVSQFFFSPVFDRREVEEFIGDTEKNLQKRKLEEIKRKLLFWVFVIIIILVVVLGC